MKKKSQAALEYLMVLAIALGLIVPLTYIFFRYTSESNVQILDSQINSMGRNMIVTAETVYFSGKGSKITLDLNMPKNVRNIEIKDNRELIFYLTTEIGEIETVFFSSVDIPITSIPTDPGPACPSVGGTIICDLSSIAEAGLKKVKIEAIDDGTGAIEVLIEKI